RGFHQHVRGHERVSVAVTAHPAAHGYQCRKARPLAPGERRDPIFHLRHQRGDGVDERIGEVRERVLDLVAHAQLHGPHHARLPEDRDQAAHLGYGGIGLLGHGVGRIQAREAFGHRELAIERALALDLRGVRREHRLDPDRGERLRDLAPVRVLAGLGEEAADRRRQRARAAPKVVAVAADVVAVLGDVGEEREVAERPDHHHRLGGREGVQHLREALGGGGVLEATGGDRELADFLHQRERRLAFVGADRVAEDAPQEPDVLAQPGVFFESVVHFRYHSGSHPQRSPESQSGGENVSRHFRFAAAALFALVSFAGAAAAEYPTRTVKLVVPYPPGGTTDVLARLITGWLSQHMPQQFIVENRPGGGNNIGTEYAINSPPDGYTMILVNPANGINATLYKNLSFNFVRDVVGVAGLVRTPNVMEVNPNVPAKTVAEFIAHCKANPGKINMASSGSGPSVHLSGELFKVMTGCDMLHVP